jgi:hypothetical protein
VTDQPMEDQVAEAISGRVFALLSDELGFHPDNCTVPGGHPVRLSYDLGEPDVYPLFVEVGGELFEVDVDVSVSRSRGMSG